MKQAFSAAFGPLCFWGNPLWSVLGFAVWFMLTGKEVHTPLPALHLPSLGVEQDFWKVADTWSMVWELLPEPSLSLLRLSARMEGVCRHALSTSVDAWAVLPILNVESSPQADLSSWRM